jgi:hypothetical protein
MILTNGALKGEGFSELMIEGFSEAGLSDRVIEALNIRKTFGGEERTEKIREVFSGLSDEDILKELSESLFALDESHKPPFDMRASTPSAFIDILREDKELILDDSYLRNSLKNETNPRRFYLLRQLSVGLRVSQGKSYVDESRHMLFESGVVAKALQASMREAYYGDVSRYAYQCIVDDLRKSKEAFNLPDEQLSHDEKVVILKRGQEEICCIN